MTFAPPVSRGSFHYNGNLYVDVGNCNRHERATVEEVTAFLRPDLKKSKKVSVDQSKDQVGHWYEAQLIHYGLPPSKDKARAKMRLLEALNQSKLIVPSNIVNMEAEMKKEYAAAERKAKAQYKASMVPAVKSESTVAGKKRKQSEPSGNVNNINVNISLGNHFPGFPGAVNATSSPSPAKKAKTAPSKPTNKKAEGTASSKPSKKTAKSEIEQPPSQAHNQAKQTARSSKLTEAWLKDPSIGPGPINPATGLRISHPSTLSKGATEKKTPVKKEPNVKKASSVTPKPKVEGATRVKKEAGAPKEPKPKQEAKVKKESPAKPSSKIKQEAKVKKESPAKPSPKIKHEPTAGLSRISNSSPLGLINGIYDLNCPTVEREWGCTDLTIILTLDGTSIWGAYDLGMFSGILSLPHRPWQASDEPLPFTWRGRENGEGEMSFGDGCEGEVSFLGNGRVEGWIGVYGRCKFEGVRRVEAGTNVRSARSMRDEWGGYNQVAYDEANRARWG